jgi:hypothetical protein
MGGICRTHGANDKCIHILVDTLKGAIVINSQEDCIVGFNLLL